MEMPNNKIAAIKAIRSLPTEVFQTGVENNVIQCFTQVKLGLHEAKELVEAIMEIQPANVTYQIEDMKAEILQLKAKVNEAELKYFHLRDQLVNALDNNPSPDEKDSYNPSF